MKRICVFGDSITWGMGISERTGWADLLRNHLEKISDYYLELYTLGIDRNTSFDLLKRIENESEARKPDLIIIDIGTNDSLQYMKNNKLVSETNKEQFINNLQKIIGKAKQFTDEIIFIGLAMGDETLTNPLPRSTTGKCYTKKRLALYDCLVKQCCHKNNISYIEIGPFVDDSDFIDGLHPNASGHRKIFDRIIDARGNDFSEKITIVDKNDNVIGTKIRSDIEKEDIYRVSALWLENTKEEVLLAKRSANKSKNPNLWMPVIVSGTVTENETYEENIQKEVLEEIGIDVSKYNPVLLSKNRVSNKHNFFVALFKVKAEIKIENLKIDKNETSELKWFKITELREIIKSNPETFVPEASEIFKGLL